jgi:hypothetical protein
MAQVNSERIFNNGKSKRQLITLITSGCSFSEPIIAKTWPLHLEKYLAPKNVNHLGLGSQGNGMISRKAIHAVHTALKTTPSKKLLVGIMWSGPSRHEQYSTENPMFSSNIDGWMNNPTKVDPRESGGWIIYNANWKIPQAQHYYRHMYDPVYAQILTLEHIIRTQNYLKLNNINYFMSTYTKEVFEIRDHVNLDHLYEQIDFDKFLPVEGEYEWALNESGLPWTSPDFHPSNQQHRMFAKQVILPFIKEKYNIDSIN